MYYDADLNNHGLAHDPFKALVAPRPIGWVSTLSATGAINLAPYSFFNALSSNPRLVMISSEGLKDTVRNIAETGEFVCSLATYELRHEMNQTSAPLPHGESEFDHAGLAAAPSVKVRPPRVARSPVSLECVAVADELIVDGRVDITRARPIARLGYKDYAVIDSVFELTRPPGG